MTNDHDKLDNMLEIIIDDILEATDEEIINEAIEDGIDIEKEAHRVKCILNKCRYDIAKKIVENKKSAEGRVSNIVSIEDARKKINEAIKKNPEILMAARFGENIPDEDVRGYYEDFCELGLFDEDEPTEDR